MVEDRPESVCVYAAAVIRLVVNDQEQDGLAGEGVGRGVREVTEEDLSVMMQM
jgi:hypothetical protein